MAPALIALASFGLFGCCANLLTCAWTRPDASPQRPAGAAAPAPRRPGG